MSNGALRRGRSQSSDEAALEFFAHETHHLGLQQVLDKTWGELSLSVPESYVTHVLNELVLEGSATYLIDFDADVEAMPSDPGFSSLFSDIGSLLELVQGVVRRILSDGVATDAEFESVVSPIVGNRYHAAGAFMLATIDRAFGRQRAMDVNGGSSGAVRRVRRGVSSRHRSCRSSGKTRDRRPGAVMETSLQRLFPTPGA